MDGFNKIIRGVSSSRVIPTMRKYSLVTKPDLLDISKKEKRSKFVKIKNFLKENLTYLDKETVKNLEKSSFDEFLSQAQKLIIKSYNIPESLAAPMQVLPEINKKAGMMYDFANNLIYVNPKILKKGRSVIFSIMKHEYKHQKQNYNILRTEHLGEHAVNEYAWIKAEFGADAFIQQYSGITNEELETVKPQLGSVYDWILNLKKAVAEGPEAVNEFRTKIIENDLPVFSEAINALREKVIQELGMISEESKEARYSYEYFKSFMQSYKNPFGFKTFTNLTEVEAYNAQNISFFEYIWHKLF